MATVDIHRLAALARLSLTKEDADRLEADLAAMIAFADRLSEETEHVCPKAPCALPTALREDVPSQGTDREALLAAAKTTHGGYVTVPKLWED